MSGDTVAIYDRIAASYAAARRPVRLDDARRFGQGVPAGAWRADLGCGAGRYTAALGTPVVAIDGSAGMLALHPPGGPPRVQADLTALPLRRGALGGAWAAMTYHHLPREAVPMALADLHLATAVGAPVDITVVTGDYEGTALPGDDFPGRYFGCWSPSALAAVVAGAGFAVETADVIDGGRNSHVAATRMRSLPDTVGAGMRLLVCGLNPSEYSADAGVGYARPGNRFWPAALAAGIVSRDRDPWHALRHHGVGMTDLVKRATPAAAALTRDEYRDGAARVARLVEWLQPAAVCFVGLAGYRAAVDRRAGPGWQPAPFGGRPAYVMGSTSGLNARTPTAELTTHLRTAATALRSGT